MLISHIFRGYLTPFAILSIFVNRKNRKLFKQNYEIILHNKYFPFYTHLRPFAILAMDLW
jgi:hypothetical protein